MITSLCLYVLATIDAAFAGFRAAAGRSGLIRKGPYYRGAMIRGAFAGQIAVLIASALLALLFATTDDAPTLRQDLLRAGHATLQVYLPYGAMMGVALLARQIRSVDVRSTLSALVFGPLTLLRVPVVIAGLGAGVLSAPRPQVIIVAVALLPMMLLIEPLLGRRYRAPGRVLTQGSS